MLKLPIVLLLPGIVFVEARAQPPGLAQGQAPNSRARPTLIIAGAPSWCSGKTALYTTNITEHLSNVAVNFPVNVYVNPNSKPPEACVQVVLDAAGGLQQQIGAIAATFGFPTNNCASYKPDNPVGSLSTVTLGVEPLDSEAVLTLAGKVTVWTCLQNPIPNTTTKWRFKTVLGIKSWWPVVVTSPGSPIKTVLLTQPFTAQLFLAPQVTLKTTGASPTLNIGLDLASVKMVLGGQYSFITNEVLSIAGVNVSTVAYDTLKELIDLPDVSVTSKSVALTSITGAVIENPSGQLSLAVWGPL